MSIWTAFFLVVSIVILAAPLLLLRDVEDRGGYGDYPGNAGVPAMEDDELELDFASGRLAREDYEEMSG